MPNVMNVLKDEIVRLARKEVKGPAGKMHKDTVGMKRTLAAMKRQLVQLQREVNRLGSLQAKRTISAAESGDAEGKSKPRFSAKGIRALRKKLGLSQAEFARLLSVSPLSVYNWEHKPGRLALRLETKRKLAEIRGIGRRQAVQLLEASKPRRKARAKRK